MLREHYVEIVWDGWTCRHIGSKGVLLRRNIEHIARCREAVIRRYDRETEVRFEQ
ncbi:MAG: hypothetical protein ACJ8FS_16455 [Sphingomicrobium sp.]